MMTRNEIISGGIDKIIQKVFIVDDSNMIRGRIISLLSTLKEVEIAGIADDSEDAIKKIRDLKPDAVILDIKLTRGTGIDVLKVIKKEFPDMKVIMLTNFPFPAYVKKCQELGADYFFDKSNDFEKLVYIFTRGKH